MSGIVNDDQQICRTPERKRRLACWIHVRRSGMRILEKMAVKIGGGVNHRIGLFDMTLKDNHVDFAGGIDKAITRAKEYCKAKGSGS